MTTKLALAALLAAATVTAVPVAHAAPAGQCQEDMPCWSCVDDGDRICGPGNANGAPAGCYDDGGVLVAAWPCRVVVNQDGSADILR